MGKGGRIACIFTPMALTIASFILLLLVEIAGSNTGTLNDLAFFQANLTNLTIPSSSDNSVISGALDTIKNDDSVAKVYDVYLFNYCSSNGSSSGLDYCSKREKEFVFNPLEQFGLSITNGTSANSTGNNAIESAIDDAKNNIDDYEDQLLGDGGRKALDAYKSAAKWMWIAYQVAFWSSLVTIVVGILAIFSRWGSFLTWIVGFVSSLFTLAAVLTSTILFAVVVAALNEALKKYGITFVLGHQALVIGWIAVACSWGASLFWLFSVCCCSGRSNPHHRSNKGGLWNAEPAGYGGRGLQVEKTGGFGGNNYQRVVGGGHHEDTVPLQEYGAPMGGNHQHHHQQGVGYEPYRHS